MSRSLATPAECAFVQPLEPYEASVLYRYEPSQLVGTSNEKEDTRWV